MPFDQTADEGCFSRHGGATAELEDDANNNPYLDGWRNDGERDDIFEKTRHSALQMPLEKGGFTKLMKLEDKENDESNSINDCGLICLRKHELSVEGVHVDQCILPGFKYKVRRLGVKNKYLFEGRALHLLSISQGYGKRITFESKIKNLNSNYFWSDSNDDGYGFSLIAVEHGDKFTICNLRRRPIGHAIVEDVDETQTEINSKIDGTEITKEVGIRMRCRVRYTSEPHGMMSLRREETVFINGLAVVAKSRTNLKAVTKLIKNIELMSVGPCLFVKEQ
ncbi:uncharacterized protein [Antedon mediterranea]|uniref:uncharacterized protein n=1 Tax=Antedon mediterranea TaxID=105859 RepID=UPI003AF55A01